MDPFADLLDGVRARTAAFCQAVLEPPWALRIADGAPLALVTTMRGHAWVVPDGGEPVHLRTGDVALVKGLAPYTVADDPATVPKVVVLPEDRLRTTEGVDVTDELVRAWRSAGAGADGTTVVASGTYRVTGDVTARLLSALPSVVLVRQAEVEGPVMSLLGSEVGRDGPGQQVLLDRLLDLALIETLRAWFARPGSAAPGWYRAQGDAVAGPALRALHDDPARPWTVAELAADVGCSRAALARRFTTLVGEPPMTYLRDWRIALAADLLRSTDLTVDAIARRVGYANPFALSVAFKRARGTSPARHRAGDAAVPPAREPGGGGSSRPRAQPASVVPS